MKHLSLLPAIAAALLLAACATPEYHQAAAECRVQAQAIYPVVLEQRMFRRSRDVWVPDGSTVCESDVTTTSNEARRKQVRTDGAQDDKDSRDGHRSEPADHRRRDAADGSRTVRERSNATATEITHTMQVCRPGMRRAVEYYDEPGTVDVNADAREHQVAQCAATLCVQRFGNDRCKK